MTSYNCIFSQDYSWAKERCCQLLFDPIGATGIDIQHRSIPFLVRGTSPSFKKLC